MINASLVLLSSAACLLLFIPNSVFGAIQEVTVFSQANCTGFSETFNDTISFPDGHWAKQGKSFHVTGIWRVQFIPNTITPVFDQPGNRNCRNLREGRGLQIFWRRGPVDTSTSALVVTEFAEFYGREYTITEDIADGIDDGDYAEIRSITLFSNDTWAAYSQENYQGTLNCICPVLREGEERGKCVKKDGVLYYSIGVHITIHSIKRDRENLCSCDCEE